MDKLIVLAAIVALILFALVACGLAALFLLSAPAPQGQPAQQAPPSPVVPNGTVTAVNESSGTSISPEDYSLWLSITNPNVESACFEKAKEEAGGQAWAVKGCTCQETVTPERKYYDCTVDTVIQQGTYFAKIDCGLPARNCLVTTNFGVQNVTFDQLRQLYQP